MTTWIDILEPKVEKLQELPERVSALEGQVLQLRAEMRGECSAVREEMRAAKDELRAEMRAANEELGALGVGGRA